MNKKGEQIITLRKKGKTYSEIEHILQIPKSTIAWWLRDVRLSQRTQKILREKSKKKWSDNITAYNRVYAKIRSEEATKIREGYKKEGLEEISKEFDELSFKDLKIIGIALYWAEGNKKDRNMLRFCNSDPSMIKIMMRFLREIIKVPDEKITAKMHIYPQINPQTALSYWSKVTDLPEQRFAKPFIQISKMSEKKRNPNTLPYGTLHLEVYSTEIIWRIRGWLQGIIEKI